MFKRIGMEAEIPFTQPHALCGRNRKCVLLLRRKSSCNHCRTWQWKDILG